MILNPMVWIPLFFSLVFLFIKLAWYTGVWLPILLFNLVYWFVTEYPLPEVLEMTIVVIILTISAFFVIYTTVNNIIRYFVNDRKFSMIKSIRGFLYRKKIKKEPLNKENNNQDKNYNIS